MRRVQRQRPHDADGLLHAARRSRAAASSPTRSSRQPRHQRLAAAVPGPQQQSRRLDATASGTRSSPASRARRRSRSRARRTRRSTRTPRRARSRSSTSTRSGTSTSTSPTCSSTRSGTTWANGQTPGRSIPIEHFFIAKPADSVADDQQRARRAARTSSSRPGVYDIDTTIKVKRPDTIVLGLGMATLTAQNGVVPMTVADVDGRRDLRRSSSTPGPVNSPVLLQVGTHARRRKPTRRRSDPHDPTVLHDVFFRIGGPHVGKATVSLEVNSDDVILDHIWAWRADHGTGVGWTVNTADTGVVVNGDDVTRHRPLRRALPEVQRDLERRERQDDHVPERAAVRPAEPGRLAARRRPRLGRVQGRRLGARRTRAGASGATASSTSIRRSTRAAPSRCP